MQHKSKDITKKYN